MKNINSAIKWLISETNNISFGEVSLTLVLHCGEIKRIEKRVTTKEHTEVNHGERK